MTTTISQSVNSKEFYNVSSPFDKINSIEMQLLKIFEDELKSESSILISYKPQVIKKITSFIKGDVNRCASIGVAGETASGKSTITLDIIETIELFAGLYNIKQSVTRVNTDDYYYDRSEEVKKAGGMAEFAKTYDFDVPEALELDLMKKHITELLNGHSVLLPKYDMSGTTIRWDNYTKAFPSKIIISEGLFTLTEKIKDAFDFKIYVDIDSDIQKERFFIRANERGLGCSANVMYENASKRAKTYIRPCKETADIVLSGEAQRIGYKLFLSKILSLIEQIHFSK